MHQFFVIVVAAALSHSFAMSNALRMLTLALLLLAFTAGQAAAQSLEDLESDRPDAEFDSEGDDDQGQSSPDEAGASRPQERPLAPRVEPDDSEVLEAAGVVALGFWTLSAWVGSPVALIAITEGDIGTSEALVLSATNLLGVGTIGVGFAVMGVGAAMALIGALGYLFTLGYWDEAAAIAMSGLVIAGVGALLTFAVAPVVFTFNAWLVDGAYGSRPKNIFLASGALIAGSVLGGVGGFYVANLLVDIDDWPVLTIFAALGTSLLVGNISYAMTRRATDAEGPRAVFILPPVTF